MSTETSQDSHDDETPASMVNVTPGGLIIAELPDQLNPGGLFRCCTETVRDLYPDGPARVASEGQILQCKTEPDSPNHRMIFRLGVWEWLREDEEKTVSELR